MAHSQPVLVAGATGHLGRHVVQALQQRGVKVVALTRPSSATRLPQGLHAVKHADACDARRMAGCCDGVHTVISCMASSMSAAGPSVWEIDRGANMALFDEAARAQVCHFVLVATFEGREARVSSNLSRAKEEAVDYIAEQAQRTGLRCSVIRPTAYFKDFTDYPWKAVRDSGALTLMGSGATRFNPIHAADVAAYICQLVLPPDLPTTSAGSPSSQLQLPPDSPPTPAADAAGDATPDWQAELVSHHPIGGPEVLTLPEVAALAAAAQGRDPGSVRIRRLPAWVGALLARACRLAGWAGAKSAERLADGLEFMIYSSTHDAVAPAFGRRTVREHYAERVAGC